MFCFSLSRNTRAAIIFVARMFRAGQLTIQHCRGAIGDVLCRHCEEPTGRANARPMTGSATKQSILSLCGEMDCFASLAMTIERGHATT
jgi:hypothetical protein